MTTQHDGEPVVTPGIGGTLKTAGCALLIVLALVAVSVAIAAGLLAPDTARTILALLAVAVAITGALVIGGIAWGGVEILLTIRAKRKRAQNESEFNVYETQTGDLHIRELNKHVDWRAASRDPRVYANGRWVPPTAEEVAAFTQWASIQAKSGAVANLIGAQVAPQLAAPPIDLMSVLQRTRKVLIVGPEGAGKTSLLHSIIGQRLGNSLVVVVDPHGNPADWPQGCEVVGPGRRYDLIEQRFRDIEHELDKRYKLVAQDAAARAGFAPITLIVDEWSLLVDEVDNGAQFIKMMLTESRKVNINAFIAGHSERVELLGLKGKGDLKAGFVTVRLYYDQVSGTRRQTIDYGDDHGQREASYTPNGGGIPTTTGPVIVPDEILPAAPGPQPTPEEARIIYLHEHDHSYNEIARQVYGNAGGKQTAQIKAVLERFSACTA